MSELHSTSKLLAKLYEAERTVRTLHEEISAQPIDTLTPLFRAEIKKASMLDDADEEQLRLTRICAILGEHEGPAVVELLIDMLGHEEPDVRYAAGEELQGLAFERFKEVALGVESAIKRLPVGSVALAELPYLLSEVPEPGVMKLLGMFVAHADPDAVAAAIEALAEMGDPAAISILTPLDNDKRTVQLDDDGEINGVTIGELAREAVVILSGGEDGRKRRG